MLVKDPHVISGRFRKNLKTQIREHSNLLPHNHGIKLPKGSTELSVLLWWTYRDGCHESGLQDAGVAFTSLLDL